MSCKSCDKCVCVSVPAVVTFEFGQASYIFAESTGTASVVLNIQGQSTFDISYTVFTVISATDTAEGML